MRKKICRSASVPAILLVALMSPAVAAPALAGHDSIKPLRATPKSTMAFENVLSSSGITFVLDNSSTPQKYQIETMAGGVAAFDYNNDGLLDLYFANGARLPDMDKSDPKFFNRLYRNNGDGTFTDVTEHAGVQGSYYSMGVAGGGYDNDGHADLYVVGVNGNQLFHNNGDGTFADLTQKAGVSGIRPDIGKPFSVAAGWFDYDNDGHLDLLVINYLKWSLETDPSCMLKSVRTYCSPDSFAGLPQGALSPIKNLGRAHLFFIVIEEQQQSHF